MNCTLQDFNVTAFLGDWYTQYTSPYWFQNRQSSCQRARYSENSDGTVGVFNTGQDANGEYEEVCFFASTAKGRDGEGAFAVQGGGPNIPVWANYLVLGTDYTSYAAIFTCLDLGLFRSQGRFRSKLFGLRTYCIYQLLDNSPKPKLFWL